MPRPRLTVIALLCVTAFAPACDDKKEEPSKPAASKSDGKAAEEETLSAAEIYIRKSKASEAQVQLAKLSDSAAAYFMADHVERGATEVLAHRCPSDGTPEGSGTVTPPLSVNCNEGSKGNCNSGGSGPGGYDAKLWADDRVWQQLNFLIEGEHRFHYNFKWKNDPEGYGKCEFTAQAFADLDDDGVYSTYERSGTLDEEGFTPAAGLYIDRQYE
ncbi:MAG: prepilin-type cleavage/methylation domain-containing protein [Myxococcota bacterium]